MPDHWLIVLSWLSLAVGFRQHRVDPGRHLPARLPIEDADHEGRLAGQQAVFRARGHLGLRAFGRPTSTRWQNQHDLDSAPDKPYWATIAVSVSHYDAGCTLGDIIAESAVFSFGLQIAGSILWCEYIGDYLLAVLLGLSTIREH